MRASPVAGTTTGYLLAGALLADLVVRGRIDLAAAHRVLRAQKFDARTASAHFRLFALVSSSRDKGSGSSEAEMLLDPLSVSGRRRWLTCYRIEDQRSGTRCSHRQHLTIGSAIPSGRRWIHAP